MCVCVCLCACCVCVLLLLLPRQESQYPFSYLKTCTGPTFHSFSRKTTTTHCEVRFSHSCPSVKMRMRLSQGYWNDYTHIHTLTLTHSVIESAWNSSHETLEEVDGIMVFWGSANWDWLHTGKTHEDLKFKWWQKQPKQSDGGRWCSADERGVWWK